MKYQQYIEQYSYDPNCYYTIHVSKSYSVVFTYFIYMLELCTYERIHTKLYITAVTGEWGEVKLTTFTCCFVINTCC